ncbi:MAG: hypothetical protein U0R66_05995 [Mycobacterium sp.]
MTPEFAQSLTEMRLRQTAGLLEWLAENCPDPEVVNRALEAVNTARIVIGGIQLPRGAAESIN